MAGGTTKITRPGYVQDYTQSLINSINNTPDAQYANLQYQGLNENQQASLNEMMNNTQFQGYVDQLMNAGQAGTSALDNAYNRISQLYQSGNITSDQIDKLASQIYNAGDVEAGIKASNQRSERQYSTETAPNVAMQTNASGGFGSAQRLGRARAEEALVNEEQSNAENIANTAYQNAQNQASSILNANRSNETSALQALVANSGALSSNYTTAGQMSQNALQQAVNASQQSLQDRQNQYNVDYANQQGAQNQQLQNIQNRITSAQLMNGVLGQTTKTTTSGGGSGILGGMMSGAVTGFMTGGGYGALAGAAIGGASAAASQ